MAQIDLYKPREQVITEMLAELQGMIPDVYVGDDGVIRILFEIQSGQFENVFLANQLVLNDIFIATASLQGLIQHGTDLGIPMKEGVRSTGTVVFEGDGGTYVPIGSEIAYDAGAGADPMYFDTTLDGTIPNPGVPSPPVAAVGAAGGLTGTYEYRVTFVTASGETLASADSNAVSPAAKQNNLTSIPLGGTGTTSRRIYRDKNGANNYRLVVDLGNNTATTYTDNISDATVAAANAMPTVDTAHQISVPAQSQETGIDKNVLANTITELVDVPSTITGIISSSAFTGGDDEEDTESYRQRLLDYSRSPHTGSPADLKVWAESIAGVDSASVFTNDNLGTAANGHVTVRIAGPDGTQPDAATQAAVLAYLQQQDIANITIHVTTFTAVPTNVTVDVTTDSTYVLADVTPSVTQAITDYINNLAVGETLYISGIIAAVKVLSGIVDVTVSVPSTNQTTSSTQKRTPGTITVT